MLVLGPHDEPEPQECFLITRVALEHMPDGSQIVNVGTAAVANKTPGITAYVASKCALLSPAQSLAKELKERRSADHHRQPGALATSVIID